MANNMTVIAFEKAPRAEVSGELSKNFLEIKPNVFCGNVSTRQRDFVWDALSKESPELNVVMMNSANTETGYEIQMLGDPRRQVVEIEGLKLIGEKVSKATTIANRLFGKKKKNGDEVSLVEHMIETGLIAKYILTETVFGRHALNLLYQYSDFRNKELLLDCLCGIIALHDIGKCHPYFQAKNIDGKTTQAYQYLMDYHYYDSFPNAVSRSRGFRHEIYGASLLASLIEPIGFEDATLDVVQKAVEMHHNHKVENDSSYFNGAKPVIWEPLVDDLFLQVTERFPIVPFTIKKRHNDSFFTLLCIIMIVSDWIASSDEFLKIKRYSKMSFDELEKITFSFMEKVADDYGWKSVRKPILSNEFKSVVPSVAPYKLRSCQASCETFCNGNDLSGLQLAIIEDETGSGKTEAAYYLAMQCIRSREDLNGMYIALPTNATGSAMFPRINKLLGDNGIHTNTEYISGKSWLYSSTSDIKDTDWTRPREMRMFRSYACGTIDQLTKTIKAGKYTWLGMLGLLGKVLIIDEMHAYDAFIRNDLDILLGWCREFRVPVIILSATLPDHIKHKIIGLYSKDSNPPSYAYPLISVVSDGKLKQESYYSADIKEKSYHLEFKQDATYAECAEFAFAKASAGRNVGVIVNSVKRSADIVRRIKVLAESSGLDITLINSRCPISIKDNTVEKIVLALGRKTENRPLSSIVVSTQILEQSVDCDFDYLITELCPIDLIIQRLGRLFRHERKERKYKAEAMILSFADDNVSGLIYSPSVLEQTHSALAGKSEIKFPTESRSLLNYVYNSHLQEEAKDWVEREMRGKVTSNQMAIPQFNPDDGATGLWETKYDMSKENEETRLTSLESLSIAFLPAEIYEKIKNTGGECDIELAKFIELNCVVTVPASDLKKIIEDNDDLYCVETGLLKGDYILPQEYAEKILLKYGYEMWKNEFVATLSKMA